MSTPCPFFFLTVAGKRDTMTKKHAMNFSFSDVYKKNFRLKNDIALVKGNELILINDIARKLSELNTKPHEKNAPKEVLSAAEATATQISDALFSLSFFSAKRVVTIQNLEDIAFEAKNVLLKYIDSPSPDILLLLTLFEGDRAEKKDRKVMQKLESLKETIKKITARGDVIDCSLHGKNALNEWVLEEAGKYGKKMSPATLLFFTEYMGNMSSRVPSELKKLSIYCGERNIITEDDITALVVPHHDATTFMLIDAVCAGRTKHALDCLERLLDQKIKPTEVIFWLSRQYKLLLQAKLLSEKGSRLPSLHSDEAHDLLPLLPDRDNLLKIAPFAQGKILATGKTLSLEDIEYALYHLHGTDLSLKGAGTPMDEHTALELLVIRLAERSRKNKYKNETTLAAAD